MADGNKNLLADLLRLSKVDSALATVFAEKKSLEKNLKEKSDSVRSLELLLQSKTKVATERRNLCRMEEKSISDERMRLNERRRALKSLSTFKLQQAAEKEVDYGQRQTALREESLLKALEESETLEAAAKATEEQLAAAKTELQNLDQEARQTLVTLEERQKRHAQEREELAKGIDASTLSAYNRIKDKHAMNAVVAITNGTCAGCFMQIGPQIVVQISRGTSLVRCPGCGRILYLPEDAKSPGTASNT